MDVGFSRPLEKDELTDLWELPAAHLTASVTNTLEAQFYLQCEPEKRPRSMRRDKLPFESTEKLEQDDRLLLGKPGNTLKTTTPLVSKILLTWLTDSYMYHRLSDEEKASGVMKKPQGIGYGIGLAFALFMMQGIIAVGETTGLLIRSSVIGTIFRKSLRLSGRAKLEHNTGQITTMISTDATKLDHFTAFGHNLWVSPIQIVIGVGLLIANLGYSALVGLGALLLAFPIQLVLVKILFAQRKKAVVFTDKRIRLTTEVLQGIRLIKSFAWESFYISQTGLLRTGEIKAIKKSAIARSLMISSIMCIPVLAAILSFITYALSGHDLNVSIIFTSLQLFNIIRLPLAFIPFVLSTFADAHVAVQRISKFFLAEDLPEPYLIDYERKTAVSVDGDFTWETARHSESNQLQDEKMKKGRKDISAANITAKKPEKLEPILPTSVSAASSTSELSQGSKDEDKPFELKDLKLSVPKGSFVAIVGRVGSGKSSVLQALIGEMRKTRGEVIFGGSVAYVPQTAWIRNATLRENVLFGQHDDEQRFRDVIKACNLERDLEVLPNGEHTEIGEKGINLSGGQKARVSLARAAYSACDVVLLDDPLSAVDAYVGQAILDQCILNGPLAKRTRILVTHALHVLDKTDYIYVMDNGVIAEKGRYDDLIGDSLIFSRLMEEYGSLSCDSKEAAAEKPGRTDTAEFDNGGQGGKKSDGALMQAEERNTGSVAWKVYGGYLHFAGGVIWAPIIVFLLVLSQGSQGTIHNFRQGDYMTVYAIIGNLYVAWTHVLRSPTSFFDTNPAGKCNTILATEDQDTLDTGLAATLWQFLSTFSAVCGTIVLVFYTLPYLGLIFVPMVILYWMVSIYYRRTSVETKRLDSLLRSRLYASYSETLTGLSTIRAYGMQDRAVKDADAGMDQENRAYYITISIQRWLGVRLDIFGNILVLGIALFAAGFRYTVDPSMIGVVLSYALGITQDFSDMISQFAQNEQNMNAVERVLHYAELPLEGDATTPNDPPLSWPSQGRITFENVKLAYRQGLPLVLKGVNFDVKPGEKVGIVGRTGAGKSSLLQALLRTVELEDGKIVIDGQSISSIGLDTLRNRLALVPQDTSLFLGTLRENLDPQGLRTDAELISILQHAWLLPSDGSEDPIAEAKFSLDSLVGDEGSNFSIGEKQLLALCRALVKSSRIIILDEATSSVDMETDSKIQQTIQREFATSTLLCIAHRLNTIAYYDRVIVMDAGEVAEFDTVLNLYDNEQSIFRSLCNEANLQRADILRIRADHNTLLQTQQ
ncbi:hypothetical protein H0H92_013457 [Tricholoma furcatifolium]|nr:hypothetical protein H0H92_013457 [Tricholoma furcatifolium]